MNNYILGFIIYFTAISLLAIYLTIKDKKAAIKYQWRVPEATLMLVGLFGGALAMLITMKIVHHKTKHLKFMIGLPVEILMQIGICIALIIFL